MKYYTGIGSRQTPINVCEYFTTLAYDLYLKGYILRSGHAEGADQAFEQGAPECDIYIPWKNFNGSNNKTHLLVYMDQELRDIASKHHPAWDKCSEGAKKLHARNVHQVLGNNLDSPSEFLVCWTPNGSGSGGTGQAIRIAQAYGVPIFDFGKSTTVKLFNKFIESRS